MDKGIGWILVITLLFVEPTVVLARQKTSSPLDSEFMWLQEENFVFTNIATKTQLDADLAPGLVTILKGKDLRRRGFRTVLEALSIVPGLDVNLSCFGTPNILVRGTSAGLGFTKLKLMLNNAPMNDTYLGMSTMIYGIPLEQVERIEIIRGPGSALYGKWAYGGIVNVITRKQENYVFSEYGRFDAWKAGSILSYIDPGEEFDISLNIARTKQGSTGITSGHDWLTQTFLKDYSYSPGSIDDSLSSYSAILDMKYRDFSLLVQGASLTTGEYFGYVALLPPDETGSSKNTTYHAEIIWNPEISADSSMKWQFSYRESILEANWLFIYPAQAPLFDIMNNFININPYDLRTSPYYKERSFSGRFEFYWNALDRHAMLLGLEYENIKIADTWQYANYHPVSGQPLGFFQKFHGDDNFIRQDGQRDIFSVYIQDRFEVLDRFYVTGGLRYDRYQDTGNRLTPKISGCYQAADHHIIKAQYSQGFRPPSFLEMYATNNPSLYGNPDIDPETISTYELAYIYRRQPFTGRIAVFYSELNDRIIVNPKMSNFENGGKADTSGLELEGRWRILPELTMDVSLSYAETEDHDTGQPIEGSSEWMVDAALAFEPVDRLFFSIHYGYVGDHYRAANDPRASSPEYHTVRMALSYENFIINGLKLGAGISNLFNEDVRYPSHLKGYTEDYPAMKRQWWIQVSHGF